MEETVYTIRYTQNGKQLKSRWKMTEAEAAAKYAEWEVVPITKETRRSVDPLSTSMAHLQGPGSKG
jgi:hypothetical protein